MRQPRCEKATSKSPSPQRAPSKASIRSRSARRSPARSRRCWWINDVVTKGQTLAKINTEELDARVKEARAQSAVSSAAVVSARATATESRANVERMKSLADRGLISRQELEAALATAARADAAVSTALAQQAAAAASLESATSARDKAVVRSPIDGIVLSRSVEPGQTVAATLQAPVLFVVAKDLTAMCLKVEVDEADVGEVRPGQTATFTVDAYPEKKFNAAVRFLKNVPTEGSDVVTYEAELTVDNKDRLLRPGMTATATIITSNRTDVLLVPNAALRFTPPEVAASSTAEEGGGGPPLPMFGPPPMPARSAAPLDAANAGRGGGKVWVLVNQVPTPIGDARNVAR